MSNGGLDMDVTITKPVQVPLLGRPTKYRTWMPARVVELMRDGRSKARVCADLGIDDLAMAAWAEKYPQFSRALQIGNVLAQAWWEEKAQDDLNAERFHAAPWGLTMANRFNWRQKTDTTVAATVSASATMSADEIKATIAEIRELRRALGASGAGANGANGEAKTGILLPAPEADGVPRGGANGD